MAMLAEQYSQLNTFHLHPLDNDSHEQEVLVLPSTGVDSGDLRQWFSKCGPSAPPGTSSEMCILELHPSGTESDTGGKGQQPAF